MFHAGTGSEITFSGNATLAAYQQALASVIYFNGAIEPSREPVRLVQFQVFDGIFSSNTVTGSVNIILVDDNPLQLDCGAGVVNFTEGSGSSIALADSLTLSDLDSNHIVSGASVIITNEQEGDEILVDSSLTGSISIEPSGGGSRTWVDLVGEAMAMQYQVSHQTVLLSINKVMQFFCIYITCRKFFVI